MKSAHAGGDVKTVKINPVGTHNSNAELKGGIGPRANALPPMTRRWAYENHGKKAGTINAKGNK